MDLEKLFEDNKNKTVSGRYLTLNQIEPILNELNLNSNLKIIGQSVLKNTIYSYTIGNGNKKILLWSQMHGNESTTTKALLDFLKFLNAKTEFSENLLKKFTFCCVPMLNPDGAAAYTRENAANIDLNRDFQSLTQPESQLLMQVFNEFKPDYCYNLHDQRTIYGAGFSGKSATVSFLAPSFNQNCDYNPNKTEACRIINAMNQELQQHIPGQIGRFDDAFNLNCCGDTFQSLCVPTILFEAGHYPDDYNREIVRKYIFIALVTSFKSINENDIIDAIITNYLNIPQNTLNFYDILIKNVQIYYDNTQKYTTIALQYKELLVFDKIEFVLEIVGVGELAGFYGHKTLDAENQLYIDKQNNNPKTNNLHEFTIVNKFKLKNGRITYLNS
jgi:hypothetical protein